ncbi:MAG: hypothetical protein EOP81_00140 [Variovorax sp.]|nr:MAG: hypothetical protein EOP81_00140 [Variovorax sp.]
MDDEDGKIRRNLVAASAIVLLLAWLDLPLDQLAERLLGTNKNTTPISLEAERVWIAAIALLAYLALRFRFSTEVVKGVEAATAAWRQGLSTRVRKAVQRRVSDAAQGRHLDDELGMRIKQFLDEQVENRRTFQSDETRGYKLNFAFSDDVPLIPATFVLQLRWNETWSTNPPSASGLVYSPSRLLGLKQKISSLVVAIIYSKGALEVIWPIALATAAFMTCLWNLYKAVIA